MPLVASRNDSTFGQPRTGSQPPCARITVSARLRISVARLRLVMGGARPTFRNRQKHAMRQRKTFGIRQLNDSRIGGAGVAVPQPIMIAQDFIGCSRATSTHQASTCTLKPTPRVIATSCDIVRTGIGNVTQLLQHEPNIACRLADVGPWLVRPRSFSRSAGIEHHQSCLQVGRADAASF